MALELPVQTSTVPANFCFEGFNSPSWLDIVALLHVTFPGNFSLFNYGSDIPSPSDRDKPWIRLNSDGTPDALYSYAMGAWLSKHPLPAGAVIMYEGTEASIDTFDGGEAGAISAIGGPFWQRVTEMDARMPIGPGTLPSTTVLNVGDTGGEEKHQLTVGELPKFTPTLNNGSQIWSNIGGVGNPSGGGTTGLVNITANQIGNDEAHNNLPPYNAIWFIRRTARLYRRI